MDIESLRQQYIGNKFGELVLHDYKSLDLPIVMEGLSGTIDLLPDGIKSSIELWIDENNQYGINPSFWQKDCGKVLMEICERARRYFVSHNISVTDEHLFNMFQIVVLNFVYGLHMHPPSKAFIQKSIGIGFIRRLFS